MGFSESLARASRLPRERLDLSGLTLKDFTVPPLAKAMRLEGSLETTASNSYPLLRAGFSGVFAAGASDYQASGYTHYSSNNAFNPLSFSPQSGALFVTASDNPSLKQYIRGYTFLDRLSTTDAFTFDLSGSSYGSTTGVSHGDITTYLQTSVTSALRITDFRLVANGGAWGGGSHVWVEWLE